MTRRPSRLATCTALILASFAAPACGEYRPPPGAYRTSWVGNSFGGDGGPNGTGYWVQNGAARMSVAADGTVFCGVEWDEAGRCAGLYKDGKVNRVLLKERDGKETAWGWGTANNAVAVAGDHLYVANKGKKLLRFKWRPGDLDSARFVDEVGTKAEAVGLTARGDRIVVVYKDEVEVRKATDLSVERAFQVKGARDATLAADGGVWVLAGNEVRRYSVEGEAAPAALPDLDRPSAIAFDHKSDRLVVCEDGRRQQVLFFDVSGEPKLLGRFGAEGGLSAGTPGEFAPDKLFALRGAGTDADGNLYVASSFGNGPAGNLFLRSFTPGGELRWELLAAAFVDTFGFDPDEDGAVVYGRTCRFDLDLSKAEGAEAKLRAVTLDPLAEPRDDRLKGGCSVVVRNLKGRRLLYTIGQYAGGYRLYTFGAKGWFAREVDRVHGEDKWAWDVDAAGDIWHGDAAGNTVRRYRFKGWRKDGTPDYDWKKPEVWPWPTDFQLVRRVMYVPATDTLYLCGYLKDVKVESWGVVGRTCRRYDGWVDGKKRVRWTAELPTNPRGTDDGKPLTPNAVAVAGDYLFVGMVKPEDGKQYTHILGAADGKYVGSLAPGAEVGGSAGWQDMPYALQALKRKDGEYLILVEEDWRGKNLLYRWRPDAGARPPAAPASPAAPPAALHR
jgi:hypothetical protein